MAQKRTRKKAELKVAPEHRVAKQIMDSLNRVHMRIKKY